MTSKPTRPGPPFPDGPQFPRDVLSPSSGATPGHVLGTFSWRYVPVEGADLVIDLDVTPEVMNGSGMLHGGVMATLIDVVAGTALFRGDDIYERSSTTEMQISFLDAARVGPVRAVAHVLRWGGRTAVVRVEVHDIGAEDLHVATATLTFAVKRRELAPG